MSQPDLICTPPMMSSVISQQPASPPQQLMTLGTQSFIEMLCKQSSSQIFLEAAKFSEMFSQLGSQQRLTQLSQQEEQNEKKLKESQSENFEKRLDLGLTIDCINSNLDCYFQLDVKDTFSNSFQKHEEQSHSPKIHSEVSPPLKKRLLLKNRESEMSNGKQIHLQNYLNDCFDRPSCNESMYHNPYPKPDCPLFGSMFDTDAEFGQKINRTRKSSLSTHEDSYVSSDSESTKNTICTKIDELSSCSQSSDSSNFIPQKKRKFKRNKKHRDYSEFLRDKRERNRLAAQRLREKRRKEKQKTEDNKKELENRNTQLKMQIAKLDKEIKHLRELSKSVNLH